MESNELYLAWEDPLDRCWMPVGRLIHDMKSGKYFFQYLKGAQRCKNFVPFSPMSDLEATYEADKLFPLFANRLLSKSRPEYMEYLKWLNVENTESNPFLILAITGGPRETDSLEVFQRPTRNENGEYEVKFMSHGLRYQPEVCIKRINSLKESDRLFIMRDVQNPHDPSALALRTEGPTMLVGYCPRYLVKDFIRILDKCDPSTIKVNVEKLNKDAPLSLRLLCRIVAPWPEHFEPLMDEEYTTISSG